MLRTTVVGVALAISVAACTNKERGASNADTAAGSMAPAGTTGTGAAPSSTADTMGAMAPGSTSTSSAAGALDTMTNRAGAAADTLANRAGQAAGEAKAAVGNAASTAAIRTKLATLSTDQVKQLQTALNNDGCSTGAADGRVGAQTRQAVQCSMQKHGISDTDVDSLYKVLNLNFQ